MSRPHPITEALTELLPRSPCTYSDMAQSQKVQSGHRWAVRPSKPPGAWAAQWSFLPQGFGVRSGSCNG